jgi:ribosomal 50S subunit-associated protein YjgA (DUF615 family)
VKLFGWSISVARISDDAPDTLRSPPQFEREVISRLGQIEENQIATTKAIESLRLALIEDGKTLGEHLESHAKDAKRDHLRRVPTLSEEA